MTIHRGNAVNNLFLLLNIANIKKTQTIFEIGSGTGFMIWFLKKRGFNCVGSEINLSYMQYAKEFFSVSLKEIVPPKLPMGNDSCNLVCSFDVLEHIPNTDQHLEEVNRILKPGGKYVFATPNKLTNIPFEIIKEKSFTRYKEYHCSLHTYWELKSKLIANGFEPKFYEIPVMNTYFFAKIKSYIGSWAVPIARLINPDKLPVPLRTNFYVIARKL